MFYKDSNGNRYTIGRPFTYNNNYYTKAGATHETFISLGFTQVIVAGRPDDQYYVVTGPNIDGQYTSTPRDLDMLKLAQIKKQKQMKKVFSKIY